MNILVLKSQLKSQRFTIDSAQSHRIATLCGQFNEHIKQIEQRLNLKIYHQGDSFELYGEHRDVLRARCVLQLLYSETADNRFLTPEIVHLVLQQAFLGDFNISETANFMSTEQIQPIVTRKMSVRPRGKKQRKYITTIRNSDVTFGIGPAGTGKTFLAVACAVYALENGDVQRIILTRPAVEAGEKLGFLPGDLNQKIDPYLRPLFDALYELLGPERTSKLIEKNVIEVAPLAYMRGRTLDYSFIILDESQNTTIAQMKMFLTRIGFGSTVVITGDVTQVDLPNDVTSGLSHAISILGDLNEIGISYFSSEDIVRHPIVQKIVNAYESNAHKNNLHISSKISSMDNR